MKIQNQEQLDEFYEMWEEISSRAAKIATAINKLEGRKGTIDPDDIYLDGSYLYAKYDEYLGCSEWEEHNIRIEDSYLFDDSFIEDAKKKLAEKKRKEEEAKQKRIAEQKERTRQRELE